MTMMNAANAATSLQLSPPSEAAARVSIRAGFRASLALTLSALLLAGCSPQSNVEIEVEASDDAPVMTATAALAQLDRDCAGCGVDSYTDEYLPHPMAYALLASTAALVDDAGLLQESANWLASNAERSNDAIGWGLNFAWDAFDDGTTNPAETVYGITTALATRGLIDAYEASGDVLYLEQAVAALRHYLPFHSTSATGLYFWYSDQEADAFDTPNVSAMLAGQYARAAALTGDRDFRAVADAAVRHLLAESQITDEKMHWPYSAFRSRPNDLVHAAYIVQGLHDYSRVSDETIELDSAAAYLSTFLTDEVITVFSPLHGMEAYEGQPTKLWGVGMLIYTLSEIGNHADAMRAARMLPQYVDAGGQLIASPWEDGPPEPRMTAHVALGLARVGRP